MLQDHDRDIASAVINDSVLHPNPASCHPDSWLRDLTRLAAEEYPMAGCVSGQ